MLHIYVAGKNWLQITLFESWNIFSNNEKKNLWLCVTDSTASTKASYDVFEK